MSNRKRALGGSRRYVSRHRKETSWKIGDLAAVPAGLTSKMAVAGLAGAALAIPAASAFASPSSLPVNSAATLMTFSHAANGEPALASDSTPREDPAASGSDPADFASQAPALLLKPGGAFLTLPRSATSVYTVPAGSLLVAPDGTLMNLQVGTYSTGYGSIIVTPAQSTGSTSDQPGSAETPAQELPTLGRGHSEDDTVMLPLPAHAVDQGRGPAGVPDPVRPPTPPDPGIDSTATVVLTAFTSADTASVVPSTDAAQQVASGVSARTANSSTALSATNPDGSVSSLNPDGSVPATNSDVTVMPARQNPDGSMTVVTPNPDGSVTEVTSNPDGSIKSVGEMAPDGSVTQVTQNPDGTQTLTNPDGSQSVIGADGSVTQTVPITGAPAQPGSDAGSSAPGGPTGLGSGSTAPGGAGSTGVVLVSSDPTASSGGNQISGNGASASSPPDPAVSIGPQQEPGISGPPVVFGGTGTATSSSPADPSISIGPEQEPGTFGPIPASPVAVPPPTINIDPGDFGPGSPGGGFGGGSF